jgi:hypothetical protein
MNKHIFFVICIFLALIGIATAQTQFVVPPNAPATPVVSSAVEGSRILKASRGTLYAIYATVGNAAGFLMTFNSTTVPADGAVTPINCVPVAANSAVGLNFAPQPPEYYSTGIVAVFSTTGCFTKTISPIAFFHALVQ